MSKLQRHEVPGIDVKRLRSGGTVEVIVSPNVSRIGSIVPLDGANFLVIPGTSCLATIVLSLRDKTNLHRSASNYLRAPWVNPGWILLSPRDEEPSQTVLIFVPFPPWATDPLASRLILIHPTLVHHEERMS